MQYFLILLYVLIIVGIIASFSLLLMKYKKNKPENWIALTSMKFTFITVIVSTMLSAFSTYFTNTQIELSAIWVTWTKLDMCEKYTPKVYMSDLKLLNYPNEKMNYLEFKLNNPTDMWIFVELDVSNYSWFNYVDAYIPAHESLTKIIWLNINKKSYKTKDMVYYFSGIVGLTNKLSYDHLNQLGCSNWETQDFHYENLTYLKYINNERTLSFNYWEKTCQEKSSSGNTFSEIWDLINQEYMKNDSTNTILRRTYLWANAYNCTSNSK